MQRFYVADQFKLNEGYPLPSGVCRHIQVLRLQPGAAICLFNGDGYDYLARLTTVSKAQVIATVNAKEINANQASINITLLASIIAIDKFEIMLQKATELGVSRFIPVLSARSQKFFSGERAQRKFEHWRKIVSAASEQCGRAQLMELAPLISLEPALKQTFSQLKFILSPHHSTQAVAPGSNASVAIAIGPEGGFTPWEIDLANQYGFHNLALGPRILRAETAAIAGLSFIHSNYGDFKRQE